ncbi:translation initiation factor [Chamaesiphon sp. VAR_48_metabat_403]|uniref:translation initiation factor n=1 Tax=Chamaesiphon sp. VAR_48_metabat_403 TaxID=2964700 RepID=UPI00286DF166|nr:translation initiation factor [Chamaesiphon sp. VAR_48_metabat_403]
MAKDSNKIAYREFGEEEPEIEVSELPPNQHKLKIEASRKGKGGKTVTIVSGFQVSPETLISLTKTLKNQCGAGGAMKDNTIEIQGDHRQKLLEIVTKLGYKAKLSGG